MMDSWALLGRDLKEAFADIWGFTCRHWLLYSIVMVLTLGVAFGWMFPRDLEWVLSGTLAEESLGLTVAEYVSDIGDGTLFLLVLIGLRIFAGYRKNRYLQKVVVMYFAVALTTSLIARVGKNLTGRPRPDEVIKHDLDATQLTGPNVKKYTHQSFPSGHTATSLGSALPVLATAHPVIGVPVAILGGACAWSRFYTQNHYISDIFVSSVISILVSVAGVSTFKRRQREEAWGGSNS